MSQGRDSFSPAADTSPPPARTSPRDEVAALKRLHELSTRLLQADSLGRC